MARILLETAKGDVGEEGISRKPDEQPQQELEILRLPAKWEKEIEADEGHEFKEALKEAVRFLREAKS